MGAGRREGGGAELMKQATPLGSLRVCTEKRRNVRGAAAGRCSGLRLTLFWYIQISTVHMPIIIVNMSSTRCHRATASVGGLRNARNVSCPRERSAATVACMRFCSK